MQQVVILRGDLVSLVSRRIAKPANVNFKWLLI